MNWTARDLMQADPATIGADATIDQATAVLLQRDTGEVFVTDPERHLLGVVPDYALLKARLSGVCPETTVERIMSRSLTTARPDQAIDDLATAFREGRYWQLPVVERGCLLGCVSRREVLRLLTAASAVQQGLEQPPAADSEFAAPAAAARLPKFLQSRCAAAAELQVQV
jgi:CBS-domain-containing membrane protein